MFPQPPIDHQEFRIEKIGDALIAIEHLPKERLTLPDHAVLEHGIELGIEFPVRTGFLDLFQFEPLPDEGGNEPFFPLVLEKSIQFPPADYRIAQITREKLFVG